MVNTNINFDGESYIKFKREERAYHKKTNKALGNWLVKNRWLLIFFGLAILLVQMVSQLMSKLFYVPVDYGVSNIYGLTVANWLIVVVVLSICLAWVIHGFGFIIIKR